MSQCHASRTVAPGSLRFLACFSRFSAGSFLLRNADHLALGPRQLAVVGSASELERPPHHLHRRPDPSRSHDASHLHIAPHRIGTLSSRTAWVWMRDTQYRLFPSCRLRLTEGAPYFSNRAGTIRESWMDILETVLRPDVQRSALPNPRTRSGATF
jgi:hypothetical protein